MLQECGGSLTTDICVGWTWIQVNADTNNEVDAIEQLLAGAEDVGEHAEPDDVEHTANDPTCKDKVQAKICKAMARVLQANDVPPAVAGKGLPVPCRQPPSSARTTMRV